MLFFGRSLRMSMAAASAVNMPNRVYRARDLDVASGRAD